MELAQFEGQLREELSTVEVAHAILEESNEVHDFTLLLEKIQTYLGLSDEILEAKMTRIYTDLNTDGRFISLGENRWGLRAWYAIDEIDEEIVNSMDDEDIPRHRRRKAKRVVNAFGDGDEDMIDYNQDDPEDIDNIYDEVDEDELYDEDEDLDSTLMPADDDDDDEDETEELDDYASDLDEFEESDLDEDVSMNLDDYVEGEDCDEDDEDEY